MSKIDVELLRPVKTEKLRDMSKNITLFASRTPVLEAVIATDF